MAELEAGGVVNLVGGLKVVAVVVIVGYFDVGNCPLILFTPPH